MSYKVKIELEFDTFKPSGDDIFQYIKELYEDNSLGYELIDNKQEECRNEYKTIRKKDRSTIKP